LWIVVTQLLPGDHLFTHHDSTIFYGDAMIVDAQRLDAEIAAGLALMRDRCSLLPREVDKITAGPAHLLAH